MSNSATARHEAIRHTLAAQGFTRLVDAEVDEVGHNVCVMSVARRPELLQQNGLYHGGVIAYLIDNATTAAAATVMREGQAVLTAEYKLNLLAPATGQRLVCRAEVLKPGRTMTVVEARVHSVDGDKEKIVAVALATIAVLQAA